MHINRNALPCMKKNIDKHLFIVEIILYDYSDGVRAQTQSPHQI